MSWNHDIFLNEAMHILYEKSSKVFYVPPQQDDTHGTWLMTKIHDIW